MKHRLNWNVMEENYRGQCGVVAGDETQRRKSWHVEVTAEMGEADEKWEVGWRGGLCPILSMGGFSIHSMPSPPLGLSDNIACEAPRKPPLQPKCQASGRWSHVLI